MEKAYNEVFFSGDIAFIGHTTVSVGYIGGYKTSVYP